MRVAIIGAGPAGLFLGSALARRGHAVTAIDRDPGTGRRRPLGTPRRHAVPPRARVPADRRRRPRARGARRVGALARGWAPNRSSAGCQGRPRRRWAIDRCARPSSGPSHLAACGTPGLELRTGHVDAVVERGGRAAGVVVDGTTYDADLVVDASGRNGRVTRQLGERAGIGGPCGQAYVDRVYRLRPGAEPGPMSNPIAWQADCDGYLCLLFRHEHGLFSVVIVRATDDPALRGLRHEAAFTAAARAIPGLRRVDRPRTRRAGHRRAARGTSAQRLPRPVHRGRRPRAARPGLRGRQRGHDDTRVRPRGHHHAVAVRGPAQPPRPRHRRPGRPRVRAGRLGHRPDAALGRGPHPHRRRPRRPLVGTTTSISTPLFRRT